jgi:hypothetical protein
MGAWVEQSNVMPAAGYNINSSRREYGVCPWWRNATDGAGMTWVWRAEFNTSTAPWEPGRKPMSNCLWNRYHQAVYSDYTHRIHIISLRDNSSNLTNEFYVEPDHPVRSDPDPDATPLVTGTDNWNRYR